MVGSQVVNENQHVYIPTITLPRYKRTYPVPGHTIANLKTLSTRRTVGAGYI